MKQTSIFLLKPTEIQKKRLNEIFTIYNRVRRVGYKLFFQLKDTNYSKKQKRKLIQPRLMQICGNNQYVNAVLSDNEKKISQLKTLHKKRRKYLKNQIETITEKIEKIVKNDRNDRRLKGLYSRLSSVQNKLASLKIRPVVFGTKRLFRERILRKISKEQFRIRRDASFCCIGKKQTVNDNIKIIEDKLLRIHTFNKENDKKWLHIPFLVNENQKKWYNEIIGLDMYTVTIVRRVIKGELKYFAHFSYDIPKVKILYGFEKGVIGLDFNYNFGSLCNVDIKGNLLSYHKINFRNLHTYRKQKRNDYMNYKMDKIVNYCINKRKGIVIEKLNLKQNFSYNKKRNRKLNNFKTTALVLLERKCYKKGIYIKKIHPAYTSQIGKYKYSRSYNLSTHVLASYVIARRGLGFEETIPTIYKWLLSQVGDMIKPRLKKNSPYRKWSQVHDLIKYIGITSFNTSEIMKKTLLMKNVLNSATSKQPNNLKAGLSKMLKINHYNRGLSIN